jgi:hypothetical protein
MWSHSVSDRNPLCRNALTTQAEPNTVRNTCVSETAERDMEESEREIRSSPGAPRELDHAGGIEGAGARRHGGDPIDDEAQR